MIRKCLQLFTLTSAAALCALPAFAAEGMSRDQGDIIISELRQIRQLLDRQQKAEAPAPQQPAPPQRVRLKLGKEYALGKKDAPVVIVEYTDYQCPFCNRFYTGTFPQLKKEYIDTGKARFVSRAYPLNFHPYAQKAAEAVQCAGEQEKFWVLKDALTVNSARLSTEVIGSLAKDAGLDMAKFQGCLDSGRYTEAIKNGETEASGLGINGTPSFVIGKMDGDVLDGELVVGAQPFGEFDRVLKGLTGK